MLPADSSPGGTAKTKMISYNGDCESSIVRTIAIAGRITETSARNIKAIQRFSPIPRTRKTANTVIGERKANTFPMRRAYLRTSSS